MSTVGDNMSKLWVFSTPGDIMSASGDTMMYVGKVIDKPGQ